MSMFFWLSSHLPDIFLDYFIYDHGINYHLFWWFSVLISNSRCTYPIALWIPPLEMFHGHLIIPPPPEHTYAHTHAPCVLTHMHTYIACSSSSLVPYPSECNYHSSSFLRQDFWNHPWFFSFPSTIQSEHSNSFNSTSWIGLYFLTLVYFVLPLAATRLR